jgi:ribosomal protein S18 acetylase RimI-like enzyme
MRKLIKESGIRDINKLKQQFNDVVIVTHMDLDGIVSGIGMKYYFQNQGFNVIDAKIIQYGDKEWSLKKSDPDKKILYCLCDFAHGKPMFTIHLDHHDTQAGVEPGTSTSFRQARSNVETISQIMSPKEIFPSEDIMLISTVDSANYAVNDITPEMVMNYLFKFDKDSSLKQNKILMGLVTNKLLLAFKNKPDFLETLVMECKPSLLNILLTIKRIIEEKGYAKPEDLVKNQEIYVQQMKSHPNVKVEDGIIVQYGGGNMMKPGSYDRYTPFKNNPDADFIVIAWPLGLVQASCNPFKKDRALKGVNLGEIKDEVLSKWESQLKNKYVTLSTIKWVSESGKQFGEESVGFTFKDFNALYGKSYENVERGDELLNIIENAMLKPFTSLTEKEMELLDDVQVNVWDLIQANSGGHKCITNISGLNYIGRLTRPPKGKYKYNNESEDSPYVKFTKMVQNEFVRVLRSKVNESQEGLNENYIKTNTTELLRDRISKKKVTKKFIIEDGKNVNKPFIYRKQGKHDNSPGLNIKYLTPKEETTGYVNILDYENSKLIDSDIPRFEKDSDKFCKFNCKKDHFNTKNTLYLYDLRVLDEYQGNGYGKKLMNKCHQISKDNGYKYVSLIADCDNVPAQNLYKNLGYKLHQTDGKKDFYFKEL